MRRSRDCEPSQTPRFFAAVTVQVVQADQSARTQLTGVQPASHAGAEQGCDSDGEPSHAAPPNAGSVAKVRERLFMPPLPHATEQAPHVPHGAHWQFTGVPWFGFVTHGGPEHASC